MARGIYKILNVKNNKFYVGSAVNFTRRKRIHWWRLRRGDHSNKHLQAAWNKYGESSFVFVVVEELGEDVDLLKAENVWLTEHVGKEYCYNLAQNASAFGLGRVGPLNPMWGKTFSHTGEAKARISAASAARVQTEEEKAKRRKSMKGHFVAPSTKAKISASLSGDKNPHFGKKRGQSFVDKVSHPVTAIAPNGEEFTYPSIKALREGLGLNPPTVNRALKSGKPLSRGPYAGWRFTLSPRPV
jgi:group I intron endonuclease